MNRPVRIVFTCLGVYACWLGMMSIHELGHVLHARVSGGAVQHVSIPPAGFSLTTFSKNPHPGFVAWGGPVWGCVIPLVVLAGVWKTPQRVRRAMQFFAGFCLIANGIYLGIGWTSRAGDAGDLMKHGTPVGVLIVFGILTTSSGLCLWHRLGTSARRKTDGAESQSHT